MNPKSFLKILLKFFNFELFRYRKNFDELLKILIKNQKPIILDVGANKGQSIDRFKKIFTNLEIHSFEPLSELNSYLLEKYKNKDIYKDLYINELALSDKIQRKEIFYNNLGNFGAMSGFYKLKNDSKFKKNYKKINKEKSIDQKNNIESTMVSTITLDEYVEKNNIRTIDLLKIDTQGHEKEVLIGSQKSLEKKIIKTIELELILNDSYEENFYFYKFDQILSECGYKVFAINNHGNLIDNPGLNIDLLYTST